MRWLSEKQRRLNDLHQAHRELTVQKHEAAQAADREQLSAYRQREDDLLAELAELSQANESYTCFLCHKDFPPGKHMVLGVVSIAEQDEDGRTIWHLQAGLQAGACRFLAICPNCKAHPLEYCEIPTAVG